jgi:hypothetical protein
VNPVGRGFDRYQGDTWPGRLPAMRTPDRIMGQPARPFNQWDRLQHSPSALGPSRLPLFAPRAAPYS